MNTQSLANIPLHCLSLADEAACPGSVKRVIGLERSRAAAWLVYLETLLASCEHRSAVDRFAEDVSDACWLARWKRENVVLEMDITALPELISQLIPAEADSVTTSALQDILATLATEIV